MHPLKHSSEKISLTVSVEATAGYQLSFLKCVNQNPELYNPDFLKKSLYRYEVFWLPLAAKHDPKVLVAPLDIEWVWHCHILSPIKYGEDCNVLVGKLINHALFSEHTRKGFLKKSKEAWQKMYPDQPFEISPGDDYEIDSKFESKLTYDVIAAAMRQKVFLYQVSLPHFTDGRFLKQSMSRYKKYLMLKKSNPGAFLVPCYDIDLMWHTHQLHPVNYAKDTTKLFQRVFNHDDSVNDRSPNSKLSLSDADTRLLWKKSYNENFAMPGAMYRGDPPDGKLYKITKENLHRVYHKKTKVVIKNIRIENMPAEMTKFHLAIKLIQDRKTVTIKKLKGPALEWEGKALLESELTTVSKCSLELVLFNRVGVACCGDTITLGKCSFDMQSEVHFSTDGQTFCKNIIFNDRAQTKVEVKGSFTKPIPMGCKFSVKAQVYENCTMPLHIESIWGPVPLPQHSTKPEKCSVAEHLLYNSIQMKEFTCRIVHCISVHISVIQVYYHDKMAVVAHLIGVDQLPSEAQVGYPDCCTTLNPQDGERAVLIKNHYGDWGIVVGKWEGARMGVPGIPGSRVLFQREGKIERKTERVWSNYSIF